MIWYDMMWYVCRVSVCKISNQQWSAFIKTNLKWFYVVYLYLSPFTLPASLVGVIKVELKAK